MTEESQHGRDEHLDMELDDLRKEVEHFQKEKERIRAIVGKIGGAPKTHAKFVNALFIAVIVVSVAISIVADERWRLLMIELATVTLSIKIIYLIHAQMRVAHFEFWILSSLEWRVNEITKQLRELRQERENRERMRADEGIASHTRDRSVRNVRSYQPALRRTGGR